MIVVDASVAVKWFLKETFSNQAIALMAGSQKLVGPMICQYEVAGALLRAWRREDIDKKALVVNRDRWLHSITTNVVRLEDDHRDIIRGSEIGMELGHPLADCIYLAMAERLDCPLITADKAFFDKARATFESIHFIDDALALAA